MYKCSSAEDEEEDEGKKNKNERKTSGIVLPDNNVEVANLSIRTYRDVRWDERYY